MKTNGTNRHNQLADDGETTINGVNTTSSGKYDPQVVRSCCGMRTLDIPDIKIAANVNKNSWIATVIKECTNSLQSSIDEAAETHRMLIHMKGISALTKHTMNKMPSSADATESVDFCLICEKQVSRITHLLSLRQQKVLQEENRFGKVLKYAELWQKNS